MGVSQNELYNCHLSKKKHKVNYFLYSLGPIGKIGELRAIPCRYIPVVCARCGPVLVYSGSMWSVNRCRYIQVVCALCNGDRCWGRPLRLVASRVVTSADSDCLRRDMRVELMGLFIDQAPSSGRPRVRLCTPLEQSASFDSTTQYRVPDVICEYSVF